MKNCAGLPLIGATQPNEVVAFDDKRSFDAAHYIASVRALAKRMPSPTAQTAVLNLCADRYQFAIGLGAALLCGLPTLMPASHTEETLNQLRSQFSALAVLTDGPLASIDLPQIDAKHLAIDLSTPFSVPLIAANQLAAYVFTSGSTGLPKPHAKHFGALVANVRAEAARFDLLDALDAFDTNNKPHARASAVTSVSIVGTVPPQHMYGFETTVLLPLLNGHAFYSGRPFFPADLMNASKANSTPKILVTTPVHLRAFCAHTAPMPKFMHVISATAPLDEALAKRAEQYFAAPVSEIYGCTEAGQVATRRTTEGSVWHTFENVEVSANADGTATVSGGHVESPVILSDFMRVKDTSHFELLGRTADLINIAGKRVSLAYLNHHLQNVEGVEDGSFFWPDHNEAQSLQRLVAFVVAPTLPRTALREALMKIIDPAFMPRPIIWLERLPRNSTGKLTRSALQALYETHQTT